jgi:hypothetical protein
LKDLPNYAFRGSDIRSILIPRSVERIGESCFEGCTSLCEVVCESESKLKTIDDNAFRFCPVKRMEIPQECELRK